MRWAAFEWIPTITQACRGLLRTIEAAGCGGGGGGGSGSYPVEGSFAEVDVARLTRGDRTGLIDRLLGDSEDAENFFHRIRHRFDASVSFLSLLFISSSLLLFFSSPPLPLPSSLHL